MIKPKVGVFGSAFDPPTRGHYDVLKQAAMFHDKILLVPSVGHPFSKKMLPFEYRVDMLGCFVKDIFINACEIEICRLEESLVTKSVLSVVYTFDLMTALEAHYNNDVALSFIRGPDNAKKMTWQRFYRAYDIEKRWSIFTAVERVPVRSSLVRRLIAGGDMKKKNQSRILNKQLLPSVFVYIKNKGLYLKGEQ